MFLVLCVLLGATVGLGGQWWVRKPLPTVTIENAWTGEGDPLGFTLNLSELSSVPVVVRIATVSGTASAVHDYVPIPLTAVTFEPGEMWKEIRVETRADYEELEHNETVVIKLLSAVGADVIKNRAIGTIINGPAPPEISVTRFYGDGADLKIDCMIAGDVWGPFKIGVFLSYFGDGFDQQLAVRDVNIGDGKMPRGNHTLTLTPAFDDSQRDYYLMVMVDSDNDVPEVDEPNNFADFDGGSFVVREPTSGKTILHIHGTNRDDSSSKFIPTAADEVHFRGHGGNDEFDFHAFLPGVAGWLFGGDGDDMLIGSSQNDVVFGGPGSDTLQGAEGNDKLVGGDGCDKLHGGEGADLLYGGPDADSLFDTPESSTLDGGPGRDSFNGSPHNPTVTPLCGTMHNHYRAVEDEYELRIDLANSFRWFTEKFQQHTWHVDYKGSAIADCSVKGDVLHMQFNPGVPEDSLVQVRVIACGPGDEIDVGDEPIDQGSFHVYSIAVTGFKVERKIGPGDNDWINEQGALTASDVLRWTAQYEPHDVPIYWDVQWISVPLEDLDDSHAKWNVFASGPTPIANLPSGRHAITPQFIFKHATTENPQPAGK